MSDNDMMSDEDFDDLVASLEEVLNHLDHTNGQEEPRESTADFIARANADIRDGNLTTLTGMTPEELRKALWGDAK